MTYLVGEITLSLLTAAAIGAAIGWLTCYWHGKDRLAELESRLHNLGQPED